MLQQHRRTMEGKASCTGEGCKDWTILWSAVCFCGKLCAIFRWSKDMVGNANGG